MQGEKKAIYDLCFCGRLNKTKGVFDLIEIVKIIKENCSNILCVIIGDGPEKNNLKRVIKNYSLENNIKLMGFLTEKEKIKTIKSSKLFVLPSHEEGWGIVIGEAIACGVPVVAYELADIRQIWGTQVYWVESFKTNDFVKKIDQLLSDKHLRMRLARRGKIFVRDLDWSVVLNKEMAIMEGVK